MAKFVFGLEKVLRHRKTVEELAQRHFEEAQAALNVELQKLEDMRQSRHDAFENRFQRQVQGGRAAGDLTQVHEYLKGQDLRIGKQKKIIQDHEKQVEERREILRKAAVDTKIIEGLKEKRKEEFKVEQKKLEQKKSDDLTSARFRNMQERK